MDNVHRSDFLGNCCLQMFLLRNSLWQRIFLVCETIWFIMDSWQVGFIINCCSRHFTGSIRSFILPSIFLLEPHFPSVDVQGHSQQKKDVNSLRPSDAIWRQRTGSTLAQVMACCLTAPSHYLYQCWLIISKALWLSCKGNSTRDASIINH